MPDEHQLSSSELCDLLLATGSPSIWAEMNAALTTIAQRHGLIETTADNPDSVKLPETGASGNRPASDASVWLRQRVRDALDVAWDKVPSGVGVAVLHGLSSPDAIGVLHRWLAELDRPDLVDVTEADLVDKTGRTVRVELTIVLSDDDEREFHESLAVHGWANKLDLGLDSTVTTRFLPHEHSATATCKHCGRTITREDGAWVDPEATGDDAVWRETCDAHDTFTAEHEPAPDKPATPGVYLKVYVKDGYPNMIVEPEGTVTQGTARFAQFPTVAEACAYLESMGWQREESTSD